MTRGELAGKANRMLLKLIVLAVTGTYVLTVLAMITALWLWSKLS